MISNDDGHLPEVVAYIDAAQAAPVSTCDGEECAGSDLDVSSCP